MNKHCKPSLWCLCCVLLGILLPVRLLRPFLLLLLLNCSPSYGAASLVSLPSASMLLRGCTPVGRRLKALGAWFEAVAVQRSASTCWKLLKYLVTPWLEYHRCRTWKLQLVVIFIYTYGQNKLITSMTVVLIHPSKISTLLNSFIKVLHSVLSPSLEALIEKSGARDAADPRSQAFSDGKIKYFPTYLPHLG